MTSLKFIQFKFYCFRMRHIQIEGTQTRAETVSVSNSAGSSQQFSSCVPFHWCRINSKRILFPEFQPPATRQTIGPLCWPLLYLLSLTHRKKIETRLIRSYRPSTRTRRVRMFKATLTVSSLTTLIWVVPHR